MIFTLAHAKDLVEFFGGDDEAEVSVSYNEEGHSGAGIYAYLTEYPDEGSQLLGPEHKWEQSPVSLNETCTECGTYRVIFDGAWYYLVNGFRIGQSPPDCMKEFKEAEDAALERLKKHGTLI